MSVFDYKLALHCAPTLAGVKPANLISVCRHEWESVRDGLRRSAREFIGRQVFFRSFRGGERRVLLLVYRRDLLAEHLAHPNNRAILERYGYETGLSVAGMLNRLAERVERAGEFPHEIGVFLGYPPEDVQGFIDNKGRNFCLCGCWKVYGNPANAKRLFSIYEHAQCFFCERVLRGEEIQNIRYGGIA